MDLQVLDGIENSLDAKQMNALKRMQQRGRIDANARARAIQIATTGLSNKTAEMAQMVAGGVDFAGYGDSDINDEERLRSHLLRTKRYIDAAPNTVKAYGSAKALSKMLGYVLSNWDTAEREEALDKVIAEEERLSGMGGIDNNVAGDMHDLSEGDMYDVDVAIYGLGEAKRTFFKAVKKALKPTLTTEAQDIVAANPATKSYRKRERSAAKSGREYQLKTLTDNNGNKVTAYVSRTTVSGLAGVSDDVQLLADGRDLEYALTGENPMTCLYRYLERTRKVAVEEPELFESREEAKQTAAAIDMLLKVWGNDAIRNRLLENGLGGLNGKLKKAIKKATKKVATAAKKVATVVKKAAKKVGKAVKKVTKKVWKLVVRFNPLTLLIRAGILGFVRLNMFKIANKVYIGSLEKTEALKKGATEADYEKSHEAYKHLKKAYSNLGGKESKLRKVIEKGNKKKWVGTEYPTDGSAIKEAANKISAVDNKVAQADMDYDETLKEYTSKGYVSDSTASTTTATEEKKVEVTVIENERTAKVQTNIWEGDDKAKSLVTVPKGSKVLIDTAQTSGDMIAATYSNKTGWITTADLAGLGYCDAESVAVLGIGSLYDSVSGLGEPATATAIASASGTIASIMAKIKDIFGVAKTAVESTKTAQAVKNVSSAVKSVKATAQTVKTTAQAAKTNAQSVKTVVNNVKDKVDTVKDKVSNVKNVVNTVKDKVNTIKNVVNTVKDAVKGGSTTTTETQVEVESNTNTNTNTTTNTKTNTTVATNSNMTKIIAIGAAAVAVVGGVMLLKNKNK